MKGFVLTFLLTFATCYSSWGQSPVSNTSRYYKEFKDMEATFPEFLATLERATKARLRVIDFYEKVSRPNYRLTERDKRFIYRYTKYYVESRNEFYKIIAPYKYFSDEKVQLIASLTRATQKVTGKEFKNVNDEFKVYINPRDHLGLLTIRKVKMALVSALTLLDNYALTIQRFASHQEIRKILAKDTPEVKHFLNDTFKAYHSTETFKRLMNIIRFIKSVTAWEKDNPKSTLAKDNVNYHLNYLIETSFTYQRFYELKISTRIKSKYELYAQRFRNGVMRMSRNTAHLTAQKFKTTFGIYETKKGKMHNKREAFGKILQTLRPGDILLEKASFRVSDKFIPGYWGHVAIYLGNKNNLIELGIWKQLPKILDNIRKKNKYRGVSLKTVLEKDHFIIEVLRPGVQLTPLKSFLNLDNLAIVRDDSLDPEEVAPFLVNALNQIGKQFDYLFNIKNKESLIASELIYTSFNDEDYEWPNNEFSPRESLAPLGIAKKVVEGDLELIELWIGGKQSRYRVFDQFEKLSRKKY